MRHFFFAQDKLGRDETLLNALRGLAALLVLFAHADAYHFLRFDFLSGKTHYLGFIGVYVFFILSGFLIWTSALKYLPRPDGLAVYAIHRVTRVAPLYYVSIAVVVLAAPTFWASFKPHVSLNSLFRHAVFSQALQPSVSRTINPVLWTLTHEAIFYALVPALFLFRRWMPAVLAAMVGIGLWAWITHVAVIGPFLRMLPLFALGILLAHYRVAASPLVVLVICIATLGSVIFTTPHLVGTSMLIAVAIFAVATRYGALLRWQPLAWVGIISYSVYIWHYVLVEWLGGGLAAVNWPIGPSRTGLFLALCFSLSYLSYALIERPSMTRLRRYLLERLLRRSVKPQPV